MARRQKTLIAVPAFVVVLASVIAIKWLPNSYQSSTFILVESPQSDGSPGRAPIDLPHRLATVRQQVTGRSRLQGLIEKFNLYPERVDRGEPLDMIINDMRGDVDVDVSSTRPDSTDAFTISYRSASAELAQQVTAELASQLIADNVQALESEASGETDVLKRRAGELSGQLHEMELKSSWLISLKEDSPLALPPGGFASGVSSVESYRQHEMALGTIRDQQYKVQQQIADLDQRIAAQKQLVDKQNKSQLPQDNATFGALVTRRAELQGQRENLVKSQGLTDKHPRVVAIEDQIDSINKAMAELKRQEASQATRSPEERELATLQMQHDQLSIELQVAGRELERQAANPPSPHSGSGLGAPAIPRDAASARLAQDYLGLKQSYKEVAAKLQQAELQSQAMGSSKVARFRVLESANLPEIPVWPNRRLLGLAALALGLMAGIGTFLMVEFRKLGTLRDAADVEHYTGLPLLGAIPRTVLPGEKAKETRKARVRLALGAVAAGAAVIVLSKILLVAHLFELISKR
jgi:succinoglycan biosynthesis transport protein ExoP